MIAAPGHYGARLPAGVHPPRSYDEAQRFFGWDPAFQTGEGVDPEWEAKLVTIQTPEALVFAGKPVHRVRIHFRVAPYATAAFREISDRGLWALLNPYGGSYNFRVMRGGDRLSAHAFGAAFDFDPAKNPLGEEAFKSRFANSPRGMECVQLFEEHGWFWGGRWEGRPDSMHFQWGIGW